VPKNFFDIVCLGTELPGLVAAALLAKQGYRTLVLDLRPLRVPAAQAQGEGHPLLFVGDHSAPVLRWAVSQLGLTQELRNRLEPLVPSYQVVTPQHRVDIGGRSPDTDAELQRELPAAAAGLDGLMARVEASQAALQSLFEPPPAFAPATWGQRRALRRRLRAVGLGDDLLSEDVFAPLAADDPLRLLFELPLAALAGAAPDALGALAKARLLGHLGRGIAALPGGQRGLENLLLERFATYGGVLRQGCAVESLELPWARSPLLRLSPGQDEVGCELLLLAGPRADFATLLPEGRKRRRFEQQSAAAAPPWRRVTLWLDLAPESLPEAMAPALVLLPDPELRQPGGQPLLVTRLDPKRPGRLSLSAAVPSEAIQSADGLRRVEDAMLEGLRFLLPFLDEHLVGRSAADLAETEPLYPLAASGGACLGPLGPTTAYGRVLYAGSGLLPALGMEGAFLAGAGVAQAVAGRVRRRKLL